MLWRFGSPLIGMYPVVPDEVAPACKCLCALLDVADIVLDFLALVGARLLRL